MGKEKAAAKENKTSAKKKTSSESKPTKEKQEFHVREHVLVPKHEVLSEKEAQAILESLGLDSLELPNIFESDAAIRDLGAKPGDVIKITRKSPTAGISYFYRRVIHE